MCPKQPIHKLKVTCRAKVTMICNETTKRHSKLIYMIRFPPQTYISIRLLCLLERISMLELLFTMLFVCECVKVLLVISRHKMSIGGWRRYWPRTLWPPGISHWTPKYLPSQPQAMNSALQKERNTLKVHGIRTQRSYAGHDMDVMFYRTDKTNKWPSAELSHQVRNGQWNNCSEHNLPF